MKVKKLNVPFSRYEAESLKAGMKVYLSGTIYTARDAAHKRLCELIEKGASLPFDFKDCVIYFCGPAPAKPGMVIGSAGPTTSYRMDAYSPILIEKAGIRAMIGKGNRSLAVIESMKKFSCIYFAATGGLGAMLAKSIIASEVIAFEDLGPEAVRKLTVENFPVVVAIDSAGNNMYAH